MTRAEPYPDTFDGLIDEIDRLRRLRKKVEHLEYCHRCSWPRESYKVPHVGPYVSTASYNEALRAVLDEVAK